MPLLRLRFFRLFRSQRKASIHRRDFDTTPRSSAHTPLLYPKHESHRIHCSHARKEQPLPVQQPAQHNDGRHPCFRPNIQKAHLSDFLWYWYKSGQSPGFSFFPKVHIRKAVLSDASRKPPVHDCFLYTSRIFYISQASRSHRSAL